MIRLRLVEYLHVLVFVLYGEYNRRGIERERSGDFRLDEFISSASRHTDVERGGRPRDAVSSGLNVIYRLTFSI